MDTLEQRDGLSSRNLCGKDTPKHSRDCAKRSRPRLKILSTTSLTQCKVERRHDGLMSQGTRQSLPLVPVCLFWLLRFPRIPGFLRCAGRAPRVPLMQRIHYSYACVLFFSLPFFSSRSDVLHTVIKLRASANLANSASHTSSNRFFFAGL